MTCGAAECQRALHTKSCRAWRMANADVVGTHYRDFVVPFREGQPDYQRRWRLAHGLREIREQMRPAGRTLLASVRALLARAERLSVGPVPQVQTGVLAGKVLDHAVASLRMALAALEQLHTSMTALQWTGS